MRSGVVPKAAHQRETIDRAGAPRRFTHLRRRASHPQRRRPVGRSRHLRPHAIPQTPRAGRRRLATPVHKSWEGLSRMGRWHPSLPRPCLCRQHHQDYLDTPPKQVRDTAATRSREAQTTLNAERLHGTRPFCPNHDPRAEALRQR